jgi:hypothetical protein
MEASSQSNPPKGNRNKILLGTGLIAVVVIIVVALLLMNNGNSKDNSAGGTTSETLNAGDFLYYHTDSGSLAPSYVWMNVTTIDSSSYKFNVNNNGFEYPQTVSKTAVVDPLNFYGSSFSLVGKTSISTPLGMRSVNHYQGTVSGGTVDYYIGDNMIVYKVSYTLSSLSITMSLQSSNLSWV